MQFTVTFLLVSFLTCALGCSKRNVSQQTPQSTQTMNKPFLESYGGQSIQELIALKDSYRIDSLVLVLDQALQRKANVDLSLPERVVLAVEAMEREVNNGGYQQFFDNSPEQAEFLSRALELIGCPKVTIITMDALAVLNLPNPFDVAAVKRATAALSEDAEKKLEECNARYFANDESIDQRLFAYIEQRQEEIRIP